MCRIIVASGNFETKKVLESLILLAKDDNSSHELNQKKGSGSWKHPHGWGIAYLEKGKFIIKKSPKAIFKDPSVKKLYSLKTKLLIAHVRKKAGSEVSIKNTHPFKAEHPQLGACVFCHNGVIKDEIKFDAKYKPQGKTDSEKLFYSILSDIKDNNIGATIRNNLQKYTQTKGTNIVLANKEKTFVAMRKNILPKYYGMMLLQTEDFVLISSEKLKTFPAISWLSLQPEEIVIIQNGTNQFSISRKKVPLLQKIAALVPR